jgi:hypothetical protein
MNCDLECDLDLDFYEEIEEGNTLFSDFELEEIKNLSKKCIKKYFQDKISFSGNQIDSKLILKHKYIDLVMKTNIITAVDLAYSLIKKNEFNSNFIDIVNDDVRYVVGLIHQIQKTIPQEFVGGILLMHLELIEGIF